MMHMLWMALLALAEGVIFIWILRKCFGHGAMVANVRYFLDGAMIIGLFCKLMFASLPMQWIGINFILFFLLSVTYRGSMGRQAILAGAMTLMASAVDIFVKTVLMI